MNSSQISSFLNKTIEKTKSQELAWSPLSADLEVKPLHAPSSHFPSFGYSLIKSISYMASYKTGKILLLTYSSDPQLYFTTPPDGCVFSLRMQDAISEYSIEITNSRTQFAPELIRLYNIIDNISPTLTTLLDDFLNS